MITIEVNGAEYSLPTSYDEVTLNQFYKLSQLVVETELDYFIDVINILTDLPPAIIKAIPANQTKQIIEALAFIQQMELSTTITRTFKIGEDVYTLKELNSLNFAEQISLEMLYKKDMKKNLPGIIAILYQKNSDPFDSETHNQVAEELGNKMSINQAWEASLFFCAILNKLNENLQRYSEEQKMKNQSRMKTFFQKISSKLTSLKTMVRTSYYKGYRKAILRKLNKYIK